LNLLIRATRAAIRRPWRGLGAAALVCAVSLALAIRLEIRSSFEELLPADLPSVAQIKELSRRMGGDGNVLVNVESVNGPAGLPRAQALARVLAGEINFFNFIAYPITFGIAVDYGANIAARVRERSFAVLESLIEVGPAVVLCSWTTIIGYGSLLLSINRALRSFGWYAIIGEATTLLTALLLLPALLLVQKSRVWRRAALSAAQAE